MGRRRSILKANSSICNSNESTFCGPLDCTGSSEKKKRRVSFNSSTAVRPIAKVAGLKVPLASSTQSDPEVHDMPSDYLQPTRFKSAEEDTEEFNSFHFTAASACDLPSFSEHCKNNSSASLNYTALGVPSGVSSQPVVAPMSESFAHLMRKLSLGNLTGKVDGLNFESAEKSLAVGDDVTKLPARNVVDNVIDDCSLDITWDYQLHDSLAQNMAEVHLHSQSNLAQSEQSKHDMNETRNLKQSLTGASIDLSNDFNQHSPLSGISNQNEQRKSNKMLSLEFSRNISDIFLEMDRTSQNQTEVITESPNQNEVFPVENDVLQSGRSNALCQKVALSSADSVSLVDETTQTPVKRSETSLSSQLTNSASKAVQTPNLTPTNSKPLALSGAMNRLNVQAPKSKSPIDQLKESASKDVAARAIKFWQARVMDEKENRSRKRTANVSLFHVASPPNLLNVINFENAPDLEPSTDAPVKKTGKRNRFQQPVCKFKGTVERLKRDPAMLGVMNFDVNVALDSAKKCVECVCLAEVVEKGSSRLEKTFKELDVNAQQKLTETREIRNERERLRQNLKRLKSVAENGKLFASATAGDVYYHIWYTSKQVVLEYDHTVKICFKFEKKGLTCTEVDIAKIYPSDQCIYLEKFVDLYVDLLENQLKTSFYGVPIAKLVTFAIVTLNNNLIKK